MNLLRNACLAIVVLSPAAPAQAAPSCFLPDDQLRRIVDFHVAVAITTQDQVRAGLGPPDAVDTDIRGLVRWGYHRYPISRSWPRASGDELDWTITVWDCAVGPGTAPPAQIDRRMTGRSIHIWFDKEWVVSRVEASVAE